MVNLLQGSDPDAGRSPGDWQNSAERVGQYSEAEDGQPAPDTEGERGGQAGGEHRPQEEFREQQEEQWGEKKEFGGEKSSFNLGNRGGER